MNQFKSKQSGFTLLELLIVIAIIGVLSGIVIIALNDARNKGADAGVKSNLSSARSQAEVFYNTNTANPNTYVGVCTNGTVGGADGIGLMIITAAKSAGLGAYNVNGVPNASDLDQASCNEDGNAWAAEAPLKGAGGMWCADSTGTSDRRTTSIGSATVCP